MEIGNVVLHPEQIIDERLLDSAFPDLKEKAVLCFINQEWHGYIARIVQQQQLQFLSRLMPFIDGKKACCQFSPTYSVELSDIHLSLGYLTRFIRALQELLATGDVGSALIDIENVFNIPTTPHTDDQVDQFNVTCTLIFILAVKETFNKHVSPPLHLNTAHACLFNLFLRYVLGSHHLWPSMPHVLSFGMLILSRIREAQQGVLNTCVPSVGAVLIKTCSEAEALLINVGINVSATDVGVEAQ